MRYDQRIRNLREVTFYVESCPQCGSTRWWSPYGVGVLKLFQVFQWEENYSHCRLYRGRHILEYLLGNP